MSDKHKESAEHREDKNFFAAKSVTQMAKPACCRSTKNTLCCFDSWGVSVPLRQAQWGQRTMTHMLVFELRVLVLWDPRHTCRMF